MGVFSAWTPVIVLAASMAVNLLVLGPEYMVKQFVGFYEKPEATLYPLPCVATRCAGKVASCVADPACRSAAWCSNLCTLYQPMEKVAACAYICEMTHGYENPHFIDLVKCFVNEKCLRPYPRDGICKGENKDAVQTIKSLVQVEGDWWVIRGLNCGWGDYPGGYDGYPCQHERFIKQAGGQWINNVTYCAGANNKCTSRMIVTIANISLPQPGVVHHEYTDAPLAPQKEDWRILSWPGEGDYIFMLWCGELPILKYNGGIVLSRKRNELDIPHDIKLEFRQLAAKHDIDYEKDLCPSNNDHCPF